MTFSPQILEPVPLSPLTANDWSAQQARSPICSGGLRKYITCLSNAPMNHNEHDVYPRCGRAALQLAVVSGLFIAYNDHLRNTNIGKETLCTFPKTYLLLIPISHAARSHEPESSLLTVPPLSLQPCVKDASVPEAAVSMQHCYTGECQISHNFLPLGDFLSRPELTPEKILNFPPAAPQMPSELSRFLKSEDRQEKLVPGSLGGVGVAVTVSDDWFGSVGVCLCFSSSLMSMTIHVSCLGCRAVDSCRTYAMAPYPTARRVKKAVNCIFCFGGFLFRYKVSEVNDYHIM